MSDPREAELLQEIRARDAAIQARDAQLAKLTNELRRAHLEIEDLNHRIDQLARRLFGKSSEQLDPNQLQLLFQELSAPGPAEGKGLGPEAIETLPPRPQSTSPRPPRESASRLPEHLPVVETTIVPPQVEAAPEQWRQIGEEITERLDFTPAKFTRVRTIRPKYVPRLSNDEARPVIAELPPCILERSILTPGLLAQIIVAKYCDHLPLYRQEYIYRTRHGVALSRQTLAQWVWIGSDWLRLIYEEIANGVLASSYVQIDETPIRYLDPGYGKTRLGYLWTCHRPGGDTFYSWHTSRAASCLEKIVPVDFTGNIQCDGYSGYDAFTNRREEIDLLGCWAHVRRKFYEAYEAQKDKGAALILHLLQQLYRTEEKLRKVRAGPKVRALVRAQESQPAIQQIHRALLLWQKKNRYLPQSAMGKAIQYALGQWHSLLPYVDDGRFEIDNNLVENAIRPTAVGKKNWLFFGHAQAGERGAIIYTIIESCRRHGIDPYAYLRDVFSRLPSATTGQIKDLTPAAWAKAQRSATPLGKAA